jgi:hypothetical protein
MGVAGEPRNRDLAFGLLLRFARWFNPRFEAHAAQRETTTRACTAPQVLVANAGTVKMLGDLGRRLAYLPTTGPNAADVALVRLGRHLRFLWDRWAVPGQQLLVSLTGLVNAHWVTPQSELERQSLAALDAYIDPPAGEHGFVAAARAEEQPVGPLPTGESDEKLAKLVDHFNKQRAGSTDPAVVGPLLGDIEAHYRPLLRTTWDLLWRCRDREAAYPEARSVARRWDADREAYTRHIDWLAQGGLRRTRQSPRQAARTLHDLEKAQRLLETEEACDDPLRMVPYLLENQAVRGRVVAVNLDHKEQGPVKRVARPLVTLLSPDPCPMPAGKELWWAEQPAGREFVVDAVCPEPSGGARITLKLTTSNNKTGLPAVGSEACFSVLSTGPDYFLMLPDADPWTHQPVRPPAPVGHIEEEKKD